MKRQLVASQRNNGVVRVRIYFEAGSRSTKARAADAMIQTTVQNNESRIIVPNASGTENTINIQMEKTEGAPGELELDNPIVDQDGGG